MIGRIRRTVAWLFLIVVLSACEPSLDSYTLGLGAARSVVVEVDALYLDNRYGLPGGIVTCCWQKPASMYGIFEARMPSTIYLNWRDRPSGRRYEATMRLPNDLTARAAELPPYTLEIQNITRHDALLIIGFGENAQVTAWLSNVEHGNNISGRVIYEVATAKGKSTAEIPSYQPKRPADQPQ